MILVTGATGHLGQAVIDQLLIRMPAGEIAALVRTPEKAEALAGKGIQIRQGDYHNKAALLAAMQGVDKLLFISSSDFNDRPGQHRNVVDAAKEAGVTHILYTGVSMKNAGTSAIGWLMADHFTTEEYIKASGLTYTFLQHGLYMEVLPMFLGEKVFETGVFFPAGEGKTALVSRLDLAEVAANVLTGSGHENKTYALGGSHAYGFADVAASLSAHSGKTVAYTDAPADVFENLLKGAGLPEFVVNMSLGFAAAIKNGDFDNAGDTLEQLLGRKATGLDAFVKATY
jgi:NAD(P)H dehydrogenase (quinone)